MATYAHRRLRAVALGVALSLSSACGEDRKPAVSAAAPAVVAPAVVADTEQTDTELTDTRVGCLNYAETVSIRGKLVRETHPGRPNYTSIAEGDEEETGFYLHLSAPICTYMRWKDASDEMATDSVMRVQLSLGSAGYAFWRPKLGRQVTVRGELHSAFTGHHHAPLVLTVEAEDKDQ